MEEEADFDTDLPLITPCSEFLHGRRFGKFGEIEQHQQQQLHDYRENEQLSPVTETTNPTPSDESDSLPQYEESTFQTVEDEQQQFQQLEVEQPVMVVVNQQQQQQIQPPPPTNVVDNFDSLLPRVSPEEEVSRHNFAMAAAMAAVQKLMMMEPLIQQQHVPQYSDHHQQQQHFQDSATIQFVGDETHQHMDEIQQQQQQQHPSFDEDIFSNSPFQSNIFASIGMDTDLLGGLGQSLLDLDQVCASAQTIDPSASQMQSQGNGFDMNMPLFGASNDFAFPFSPAIFTSFVAGGPADAAAVMASSATPMSSAVSSMPYAEHYGEDPNQKAKNKKRKRCFLDEQNAEVNPATNNCACESKPVLQCMGTNMKKKTRCRNAALMEFIGPQPKFCAEHICLDPESLYQKCCFVMDSDTQPKRCKEVILKEFKRCHKHMQHWLAEEYVGPGAATRTQQLLDVTLSLYHQLEQEAHDAKSQDPDLYQRKSKLLPKYQHMVSTLQQHLASLRPAVRPVIPHVPCCM